VSWLFLAVLAVALLVTAEGKPKKYGGAQSKVYWKKENECSKGQCNMFHPDENDDCVFKCVSDACYNEVYASEPLEPGEVDRTRQSKFNACVRKEKDEEEKADAKADESSEPEAKSGDAEHEEEGKEEEAADAKADESSEPEAKEMDTTVLSFEKKGLGIRLEKGDSKTHINDAVFNARVSKVVDEKLAKAVPRA